uniref:Uncharacterized protein n=1 Tax=Romanomermis culicivorax TaxID=13658 RepID=A0A915JB90_ROMCU
MVNLFSRKRDFLKKNIPEESALSLKRDMVDKILSTIRRIGTFDEWSQESYVDPGTSLCA